MSTGRTPEHIPLDQLHNPYAGHGPERYQGLAAVPAHDYHLHQHEHGPDFEPLEWHTHPHGDRGTDPDHRGVRHSHSHRHARPGRTPDPMALREPGWHPVLQDLLDLEQAGALAGVLAIIAERLRMVHGGLPGGSLRGFMEAAMVQITEDGQDERAVAQAAALLAAEIDHREA